MPGLEKRMPYRRVIKQTIEKVMGTRGVEGARVVLSGRLGGAEIARTEELKKELEKVLNLIDIISMDIKIPSDIDTCILLMSL